MEHSQPIHLSTLYGLFQRYGPKILNIYCLAFYRKVHQLLLYTISHNSTIIQYLPNSHAVSDNLYNYCVRFFSPANQSASDLYIGFCYSSFNDLGSVFIPGLTILHSALRTCTQIIMVYILMLDMLFIATSFIYFTPSC